MVCLSFTLLFLVYATCLSFFSIYYSCNFLVSFTSGNLQILVYIVEFRTCRGIQLLIMYIDHWPQQLIESQVP